MNDPYTENSVCLNRLRNEYKKHKKLIIAVDFDDTVFPYHDTGHTYTRILNLVARASKLGFYIVVWTASSPDRYPLIEAFYKEKSIQIASINKNPVENMPFGNHGKIYYNLLLDDRAGLGQASDILEKLLDEVEFSEAKS